MKLLILLVTRTRFHIPKVGSFQLIEDLAPLCGGFRPFVFEGRVFGEDEIEALNEAFARTLDKPIAGLTYSVSVRAVKDSEYQVILDARAAEEARVTEIRAKEAEAVNKTPDDDETPEPEVDLDAEPEPDPAPEDQPAPYFEFRGKSIYLDDERVAGLYGEDKQLRVFREDLRNEIEAWVAEQPAN